MGASGQEGREEGVMSADGNGAEKWTVVKITVICLGLVAIGGLTSITILSYFEKAAPEGLIGFAGAAVGALATLIARVNGNGNGGH